MQKLKRLVGMGAICLTLLSSVALAKPITNTDMPSMNYITAAASFAAYDDKDSKVARDILEDYGWKVRPFKEKIDNSDVKFLALFKKIANKDIYIIAVAGTSNVKDVKTDLRFRTVAYGGNSAESFAKYMKEDSSHNLPRVHRGFAEYVQDGFFTYKVDGFTWAERLKEIVKNNPQAEIVLTGHSLGGAVAEILAARLVDIGIPSKNISVYTYGAPAVGNEVFVDTYEPLINLHRVNIKGDFVKNLAQIGNDSLVQFKAGEDWEATELEGHKLYHSVALYLDRAVKNYIEENAQDDTKANTPDETKVCKFEFPPELKVFEPYVEFLINHKNFNAVDKAGQPLVNPKRVFTFKAQRYSKEPKRYYYYISGDYALYNNGKLDHYKVVAKTNDSLTVLEALMYIIHEMQ